MEAKTYDRQTAKFLAVVGENMPDELSGDEMQEWIENPKSLQKFLKGLCSSGASNLIGETDFLRYVTDIRVNSAKNFRVRDYFIVNTSGNARVKFSYFGDNFKRLFFDKVENVESSTLNIYRLKKSSLDAPILKELGDRAETSIAYLLELLSKQPNGESGVLLTNGYANIFYIRGIDNNFWAVNACWFGGGWRVDAYSVEGPSRWCAGRQVVSR